MHADMPVNRFKHALAAGRTQIGLWSSLLHPMALEAMAGADPDWVLIDCEHGPGDPNEVLAALQAMQGTTTTGVVRPAWNDSVLMKRYLDLGVNTVLVPMVQSAEEAKAAVAATRYPPDGIRGVASGTRANRFGRVKDYFKLATSEMCVLVQVETRPALDRIEEIAAVDGVDGVFIGPSDLAAALGHLGNPAHPDVQAAIQAAPKRIGGKPAGILTPVPADAQRYIDWGYKFVAVGIDLAILARQSEALVNMFRK
jgi:4-hydroxy-2-oxoheptanedioate aldolase